MPKVSDGLKDEVARALQEGGADAAAELLFGVARAYSGNDPASFTVSLLSEGLEAAAEYFVREYAAGRSHLCAGETLRPSDEAECSVCVGDWASAREIRSAEDTRSLCARSLHEFAHSHRELATAQPDTAESETALARVLDDAAASIATLDEQSVPHCPSCGEALVAKSEQCAYCGSKVIIAPDGSCRLAFET